MNYEVNKTADGYLVYIVGNPVNVGGPYESEAKANRRVRDLKRKDISAGVHDHLVTPIPAAVLARDESGPRLPQMVAQRNAQLANERQRGCYPAIPKHAYQR